MVFGPVLLSARCVLSGTIVFIFETYNSAILLSINRTCLVNSGKIKGWEFGNNSRMVCANVGDRLYALEGQCPR